ncbi:MAG: ShlB/FhaC/HecB family hemolysin secretion/activation protein [Gammaproteobacteria bacterium]
MNDCTGDFFRKAGALLPGSMAFLGLVVASAVYAAPPAAILPGVVDRPPVELPPVLSGERVEVPVAQPQPLPPAPTAAEPVATLTRISFGGTLLLEEQQLQAVAAPYLNRPISGSDIARLKYDLTSLYFKKGYVLVKVTTPPQNLSDGVLDVVVIAGRIGDITVSNEALNPAIANSRLRTIRSGDVFNERIVESALQDINDLNNIGSSVSLRPGSATGTTDLDVRIRKADPGQDVQIFTLDNYGSEFTGDTIARLSLQKSNLLGIGETFGITGRKSDDDFWAYQGEAMFPLPLRNLQLELDYLKSDNSIGDVFSALNSEGESKVYQAALSSALINQRQRKLVIRGGIERGRYESTLTGFPDTSDTITKLFAETSYSIRMSRLVTFVSVRANKGIGALGASSEGDADASRLDGNPQAWTLESLLYTNYRLTDRDFLQAILQAQQSDSTLLSPDLFIIGGYGSVRGYEPAQSTGDSGVSLNLDLYRQFNMPEQWYAQAGPFIDYGYVHNRVAGSTLEENLWSAGVGAEFNYRHSQKLTSKLRLDWAFPMAHKDLPYVDGNTFYARFTQLF